MGKATKPGEPEGSCSAGPPPSTSLTGRAGGTSQAAALNRTLVELMDSCGGHEEHRYGLPEAIIAVVKPAQPVLHMREGICEGLGTELPQ